MKRFFDIFPVFFCSSYCPRSIDKRTGIRTQTGANIPRLDLTLTRGVIKTGTPFYTSALDVFASLCDHLSCLFWLLAMPEEVDEINLLSLSVL